MNLLTVLKTRREHRRHEGLSRARIEAMQLAKFRRLAAFVYQKSRHYREIMDARRIQADRCVPSDFPVLTKTELMRNFDNIITVPGITKESITGFLSGSRNPEDRLMNRYVVVHTSGTSGEVGYFVYGPDDWVRGLTPALRINPFKFGRRRTAFFGATGGHFTGASMAVTNRWSVLRFLYESQSYGINSPLEPIIQDLNRFQPEVLMGYSSALAILADRQGRGELRISPRYVQCSGEPVIASDRALVESVFGVPLINTYSCTEHLIMGYGKREWGGIYLMEDELIFELNPDHTVISNLFNYTLPLIRYRMNDVLQRAEDADPVYPFMKVKEISGRSEHIPFFINESGTEDFISPHIINEFLVRDVRRFQLQVTGKESCFLRVCLTAGLDKAGRDAAIDGAKRRLAEIFQEKKMSNVRTDVQEVEELQADLKTGKFRLIVLPDGVAGQAWSGA